MYQGKDTRVSEINTRTLIGPKKDKSKIICHLDVRLACICLKNFHGSDPMLSSFVAPLVHIRSCGPLSLSS